MMDRKTYAGLTLFGAGLVLLVAGIASAAQQTISAIAAPATSGAFRTAVNTQLANAQSNFVELYGGKSDASCFASESAFNACFDLTWIGDNPAFASVHATGGNLAAANAQVTKKWITGLSYTADVTSVIHGGQHYICTSTHTAGSTTEPGVGASWATVWELASGGTGDDLGDAAYSDVVALWTTCTGYLKSDGTCDSGGSGYTNLTSFVAQTNWRVFYSNGSGDVTELALGADGTYLKSNGASAAPTWATPSGTMVYPGAGIPNSTGSAWGTSYSLDTDLSTTSASDDTLPSAKAVKAQLDALPTLAAGTGITITEDGGGAGIDTVNVALAIASEVNTGTSTSLAITPDALAGSNLGSKELGWVIVKSDTVTAVADGKDAIAVPASMNGMNLVDVTCSVSDLNSAASGATTVVLRRVRGATAVDMTSAGVTIGYNEYTASDETVDAANDDLATGDKIFADVNAVTSAVHKGLYCTAVFRLP